MGDILHTDEEIRAAGAAAVEGWHPTDAQVRVIAALFAPVQDLAYGPLEQGREATAEAPERAA